MSLPMVPSLPVRPNVGRRQGQPEPLWLPLRCLAFSAFRVVPFVLPVERAGAPKPFRPVRQRKNPSTMPDRRRRQTNGTADALNRVWGSASIRPAAIASPEGRLERRLKKH